MQSFQIKSKRTGHVIIVFLVLLLMSIVCWAFFFKKNPVPFDGGGTMIFGIITVIGAIVLIMAIKMIIQNPAVISINAEGFEYNPGGISSGFTPWSNVADIKYVDMRTTQGDLNGPIWETALAVKLKDPGLYRKQFNPLLKGLMGVNKKMYDADIFFRLSSFGKQSEEVYQAMLWNWNKHQGKTGL